jgi:hypothetical protein
MFCPASPVILAAQLALVSLELAPVAPCRAQSTAAGDEREQAATLPRPRLHLLPADYSAGVFFVKASIN